MKVNTITVYDCFSIRIEIDRSNGCVQVIMYDERHGLTYGKTTMTVFGRGSATPELERVVDLPPERDEPVEFATYEDASQGE